MAGCRKRVLWQHWTTRSIGKQAILLATVHSSRTNSLEDLRSEALLVQPLDARPKHATTWLLVWRCEPIQKCEGGLACRPSHDDRLILPAARCAFVKHIILIS